CDGVRSPLRHLLGLAFPGEVFHDQFLIADIKLMTELPKERRFWFYPPFHPTNSVLMHRQADNILRADFQLGRDADPEEEKKPENVDKRLRQMFGPEARWQHEWTSVYTFTTKCPASLIFRDATLYLARDFPFARALINSGRLSVPTSHAGSPLDTPDGDTDWVRGPAPGWAMVDAPLAEGWLVDRVGVGFTLLAFGGAAIAPPGVSVVEIEEEGLARQRYDARPGTAYLIRPVRYVAAPWRKIEDAAVKT